MNNKTIDSYDAPIRVTPLRKVFIFLLIPILKMLAKISIESVENMPEQGAAIVACNHLSFFDGFVLQYAIPRPLFFMGKAENFKNPFLRFFMYQIGAFPVQRGKFDRSAILQAQKVLDAGHVLGMFPEGTRTYDRGMVTAKTGTAHLAMKAKCSIIPVAMSGSQNILKRLFKKAAVTVKVCPPIFPQEKMNANELTDQLMKELAKNLPEKLRGVYA